MSKTREECMANHPSNWNAKDASKRMKEDALKRREARKADSATKNKNSGIENMWKQFELDRKSVSIQNERNAHVLSRKLKARSQQFPRAFHKAMEMQESLLSKGTKETPFFKRLGMNPNFVFSIHVQRLEYNAHSNNIVLRLKVTHDIFTTQKIDLHLTKNENLPDNIADILGAKIVRQEDKWLFLWLVDEINLARTCDNVSLMNRRIRQMISFFSDERLMMR